MRSYIRSSGLEFNSCRKGIAIHLSIIHYHEYNHIAWLQNDSGQWLDNEDVLQPFICNYFLKPFTVGTLLHTDHVLPLVTPDINKALLLPITNEEIK